MKLLRFLLPVLVISAAPFPVEALTRDSKMTAFIDDLMSRMSLDEKIGQLNLVSVGIDTTGPVLSRDVNEKIKQGRVGGVFNTYTPAAVTQLQNLAVQNSRLHIPLLFGYDVIHGHKTIFPIPLGVSCTWDLKRIENSARVAATEASADGLNWTFSPMVDIARDPRWGRILEGSGEDPWYGSKVAEAMVKGYQGEDLKAPDTVLACVKHFALYGGVEGGRDYNTVDMSRIRMFQDFMLPYKAAIDAGAGSVMTSFNEVDAIPASANRWLLTDLLRGQWGFDGIVVTDYTAINEMSQHGLGDLKTVSALALKAGVDMDMVGEGFLTYLKTLLSEGKVTPAAIDVASRRILETKYRLGLFDHPFRDISEERAAKNILTPEHRNAARDLAEHSFVLLRNSENTLPLKKKGTLALIGPLAMDQRDVIGSWSAAGDWKQAVSVGKGIENVAGKQVKVLYAKGANITDDPLLLKQLNAHGGEIELDPRPKAALIQEAVKTAARADVVVAVLGESQGMSGEAASRSDIGLPENQKTLLKALVKTGKPVVLVLMNGRPLTLSWENEHVPAILETWFAGIEAGNAIADVLFGNFNPSGKLTATFPRSVGQIPVYYNHKNTGRPYAGDFLDKYKSRYLDIPNDPLYPFGFGLSYTSFEYGQIHLNKTRLSGNETLEATVSVTNTGKYPGEEVVQLYLTQPVASVTRAVRELKNFEKVGLKPGEKKTVSFAITRKDMKFYNSALEYIWEPGEFIISIGPNSSDTKSATVSWNE